MGIDPKFKSVLLRYHVEECFGSSKTPNISHYQKELTERILRPLVRPGAPPERDDKLRVNLWRSSYTETSLSPKSYK